MATSPEAEAQAVAMMSAGWTLAATAERTGLSISTVKRIRKRRNVKKGETSAELIEAARQELSLAHDTDWLRQQAAAFVHDEISQAHALRQRIQQALDAAPEPTDAKTWGVLMRGLTAAATAMKASSDQLNRVLGSDRDNDVAELPELVVRVVSQDEVAAIQAAQAERIEEFADPDAAPDDDDQEVVELH